MSWGIIVYESFGRYTPFTMADDNFYDGMKEVPGMTFVNGKKGITDSLNPQPFLCFVLLQKKLCLMLIH